VSLSPEALTLLDLARQQTVISASDAAALGIYRGWLTRLAAAGYLERVARGRYRLAEGEVTEHHTLVIVSAVAPSAVVCLLSALQYHGIGVQAPLEVWIALERGTWRPRPGYPPLRVVFLSGPSFSSGIEHHNIEGRQVRVYSVAKTVADCFRFRNRVGLDVALEALTDAWRQHRLSLAELNRYAAANGVQRVMQPYIEAVIQ
jgi:predicted transcriptional regulator of viral defense system